VADWQSPIFYTCLYYYLRCWIMFSLVTLPGAGVCDHQFMGFTNITEVIWSWLITRWILGIMVDVSWCIYSILWLINQQTSYDSHVSFGDTVLASRKLGSFLRRRLWVVWVALASARRRKWGRRSQRNDGGCRCWFYWLAIFNALRTGKSLW